MHFPYGLSDFGKLREQGYWYLDRTDRIPMLEAAGDQLIFLRPRRFGKSLLLSIWTLDKVSYQLAKIVRSHTVGVDKSSAEESER